jgi:hypothetical protein
VWIVRALLVANTVDADPGFVGERFRHHGYAFDECLRETPSEWSDLAGHDLVVLLGSEWSVYWKWPPNRPWSAKRTELVYPSLASVTALR